MGQLVVWRLVLLVAKPCMKFEVCSFSRSEDISSGVKFNLGQVTLTTPLSGTVIRGLTLDIAYLQPYKTGQL